MQGRVCLVTGATSGIGQATALGLARQGATVVLVARDKSKGAATCEAIRQQANNQEVHVLYADLSSQQSIRELATTFQEQHKQLHVLVNVAGIVDMKRELSVDGIEMTLAVNHLAPFLLTNLLLNTLKASAPARIVTVSSDAQGTNRIDLDDLQFERRKYKMMAAYAESKLANVLFTYALARRLEGSNVTANCLHPGVVYTNIWPSEQALARFVIPILKPFLLKPEQGAETAIYLASAPEVAQVSGKYFYKKQERLSAPLSYDESVQERLWEISERLTSSNM